MDDKEKSIVELFTKIADLQTQLDMFRDAFIDLYTNSKLPQSKKDKYTEMMTDETKFREKKTKLLLEYSNKSIILKTRIESLSKR